jgi:fido (protein-threonine AMPylation protein)
LLDLIFKKELGKVVDWSKVDKEDYLLAMERSLISGHRKQIPAPKRFD